MSKCEKGEAEEFRGVIDELEKGMKDCDGKKKEFRPRLTSEMLQFLCKAIVTELQRLLPLLDEAKKTTAEKIHAGGDYEPFIQKQLELEGAIRILEETEKQFQRLLEGKTKGRKMFVRAWESRKWKNPYRE